MKIELNKEIETVVVPAEVVKTSTITITNMVDSPLNKKVTIYTQEIGTFVLWEGDEYDAVGQWTDTDVVNRIKELNP
jgi:hypothetical protein